MLAYKFSRVERNQLETFLAVSLGGVGMLHHTPETYLNEYDEEEEWTEAEEHPFFTIAEDVLILWESKEEAFRWLALCYGKGAKRERELVEWLDGQIIGA